MPLPPPHGYESFHDSEPAETTGGISTALETARATTMPHFNAYTSLDVASPLGIKFD